MTPDPSQILPAACDAVLLAARACRGVQARLESVQRATKDDRSPVTVADFAAQAIVCATLRERLGATFEHLGMIAEEDAALLRQPAHAAILDAVVGVVREVRPELDQHGVLDAIERGTAQVGRTCFTLDPVDGTKGFLRQQQYAIALALLVEGTPVLGVLGCPALPLALTASLDVADPVGSLYCALAGGELQVGPCGPGIRGAWPRLGPLSGPLRACASVEKAHSSVSDTDRLLAAVGAHPEVLRLDSSAKYAVVARGQADAYLRLPTRADYVERIWDHAAGVVIAEAAGAVVSDITGARLDFGHGRGLERNRGVVVAHPEAHPRLIAAIGAMTA